MRMCITAHVSKKKATPLNKAESPECGKLLSFGVLAGWCGFLETSFPFPAKTAKMSRFPLLMISQECGQFVVGSGPEFFSNVAECTEIIAPVQPLSFQTFEDFKHERECPIQVIDGFVKMSLYAMVKATALGLRQRNGAFNVFISHCASNTGAKVRARSVLVAPGASA
jgi:hypothetical protein